MGLLFSKRDLPRRLFHQVLITLVVALRRNDRSVSHSLTDGVDVGAGLKEPRRKGSAQIMRREGRDLGLARPDALESPACQKPSHHQVGDAQSPANQRFRRLWT